METERHISGLNEDQVWAQVESDLRKKPDLLLYRAILEQQNRSVLLDIDIDLGGGFEGGFSTTIFSSRFPNPSGFRFVMHQESFFDDLGKFFGMQDVEIGNPDFDDRVIVKTNDESRVRALLADDHIRTMLQSLKEFIFEIVIADADATGEDSYATLELIIEEGITDPARLREIYRVFLGTLLFINPPAA